MNLFLIGLFLIMIAWSIQAYYIWMGRKNINKIFVLLYIFSVILLVIEDILAGNIASSIFQFGTLLSALLVLFGIL